MLTYTQKGQDTARAKPVSSALSSMPQSLHPVLQLHRNIGNQAVQRLLQSRRIQAKITVGAPNDKYEQEADRVADQVMRMPEPSATEQNHDSLITQKSVVQPTSPENKEELKFQPAEENDEIDEEKILQAKKMQGQTPVVSNEVESSINNLRGGGQALSSSERRFYETRFGQDFSQVRVHTDTQAANVARSVNARAFTRDKDIVFGSGEYSPWTGEGRRLLAHELTHVIQQQRTQGQLQRRTDPVITRPIRTGAQACLIHLHGTERNALRVARSLYGSHCVNLVYIDHPGRRAVRVDVPGHRGVTCDADPNRIFDNAAITSKWANWNRNNRSCLRDPIKSAAQTAVQNFRDRILNPAISQCRGRSALANHVVTTGITGHLPVAVFHNNSPGSQRAMPRRRRTRCIENLTIRSYLPGHCEAAATDTNTTRTRRNANPNIVSGIDVDNFYLVTDPADFVSLIRSRQNVVLQSLSAPNDGSLSVVLKSGRYINVEAENTRRTRRANQAMGIEAMNTLGVNTLPCATTTVAPTISPTASIPTPVDGLSGNRPPVPPLQFKRDYTILKRKNFLQLKPLAIKKNNTSDKTIQRFENPVSEADLPSPTVPRLSTGEQTFRNFMREVYQSRPLEEEEETLQAKSKHGEIPSVTPNLESQINSLKGGGQPLDSASRSFFEPRFGHDFSHVRVHSDRAAADTANSINAHAFTLGNHVVMGSGEYQPNSPSGKRLLEHELTHVMQQEGRSLGLGISSRAPISVQRKPRQVRAHRFLGLNISGGVNPRIATRLNNVAASLRREYQTVHGTAAANDTVVLNWVGIYNMRGWRLRSSPSRSKHCSGSAVDVNYDNQPYIVTRSQVRGREVLGGERAGRRLTSQRQATVDVFDRAKKFVFGQISITIPIILPFVILSLTLTLRNRADVSKRRTGETTADVFDRFKLTSNVLGTYLGLAFHTAPNVVRRRPMRNIERASERALLRAIPTTERKAEAVGIAAIQTYIIAHLTTAGSGPDFHFSIGDIGRARDLYFRMLRDYEHVRIPMVRGAPVARPGNTRNPARGFLDMSRQFVVAMADVGRLRWGIADLGAAQSGDTHHFDLGNHGGVIPDCLP